jgi:site-specific recombinase XerD
MLRASSVEQSLERMQRWMALRGLAANSVAIYVRCAHKFLTHVDRPLRSVTRRDVEEYLHTLVEAARRPSTRNVTRRRRSARHSRSSPRRWDRTSAACR